MRHIHTSILLLGLIFSTSALAELRVYDVEDKYRQEVFSALRGVLSPEHDRTGMVELLPTGQILIDTSPERHEEVAAVLRAIEAHQAEAAPQVTLRYWAVLGTDEEAVESAAPNGADASAPPAMLSDVLAELERVHGPLAFRVLANATLVTESGQTGSIGGDLLSVNQTTFVQDSKLNVDLGMSFRYQIQTGQVAGDENGQTNPFATFQTEQQNVRLNTSIEPGEFVVVGENTIRQNAVRQGDLNGTLFYIVHWPGAE